MKVLRTIMTAELDPEETILEQEASKEVREEEIRANVITEYGFDEVDDIERIDKLVSEKIESYKKLSEAIGQKIKYRTEAADLRGKVSNPTNIDDLDKKLDEKLEKRDIDALEYSDDLKKEIARIAKITGVSVKQALRDPYLVNKIEEAVKAQSAEEAAISRTNRSRGKIDFSIDNPPEVDFNTEEGRKEYDEWKKEAIKKGH